MKFKQFILIFVMSGFVVNSLFILRVFMEILVFGESRAIEPVRFILWGEILLSLGIFVGAIIFMKENINRMIDENN